jgi:hypothetical protein
VALFGLDASLIALGNGNLAVDLCLLSELGLPSSPRLLRGAIEAVPFAFCCRSLASIGEPLSLVVHAVALVGQAVAFIGDSLALVGKAFAPVGGKLSRRQIFTLCLEVLSLDLELVCNQLPAPRKLFAFLGDPFALSGEVLPFVHDPFALAGGGAQLIYVGLIRFDHSHQPFRQLARLDQFGRRGETSQVPTFVPLKADELSATSASTDLRSLSTAGPVRPSAGSWPGPTAPSRPSLTFSCQPTLTKLQGCVGDARLATNTRG